MRRFTYYGSFASVVSDYFTDLFGVPAAAYSLRKLSPDATYSGAAIRVRRSSDNTEQDINFVSSAVDAVLDTAALTTFVGANDGFVVTWYNQDGSSNHFTQTTAALQARIVNAGTVELLGGLPCVNILNAAYFRNNDLGGNARQDTYIVRSNSKATYLKQGSLTSSSVYDFVAQSGSTSTNRNQRYGSPSLYANKVLFTGTNRGQVFTHLNGHKIEVHENGNTSNTLWGNYEFGIYSSGGFNYEGLVSEFIVYKSDKSADRDNINDNQNDYYNVF